MKFFSASLATAFVALLSVVATMAQTSDEVISAIQSFITASSNLDAEVTPLNASTFPTMGYIIAEGFNNMTSTVNTFNAEFSADTTPYPDDAAVAVVDVFTTFVEVLQDLLEVVVDKHSLAATFGLTAPIAQALDSFKAAVFTSVHWQTFAFSLLALVPTESDAAAAQIDALGRAFSNATPVYDPSATGLVTRMS